MSNQFKSRNRLECLNRRSPAALVRGFVAAGLLFPTVTTAHEFWLAPLEYRTADADTSIFVDIRNGEHFSGDRIPLIPPRIRKLEVHHQGITRQLNGNAGDLPAIRTAVLPAGGLHTIGYISTPSVLTYDNVAEFNRFAELEGAQAAKQAHQSRQLPDAGFKETYSRIAKTLVHVDSENDKACTEKPVELGYELEFTLQRNPHCLLGATTARRTSTEPLADQPTDWLEINLSYQGQALADTQVSIFHRDYDATPDTPVSRRIQRTDAQGIIRLRSEPGYYLINKVVIREPSPAVAGETNAVWESLWSSLTFTVPVIVSAAENRTKSL